MEEAAQGVCDGAFEAIGEDLREEFPSNVWPAIRANAVYENYYLLAPRGPAGDRQGLVRAAETRGRAISHGATGKGTTSALRLLDTRSSGHPGGAPWRMEHEGRADLVAYATARYHGTVTAESVLDRCQPAHISYEGGVLRIPVGAPAGSQHDHRPGGRRMSPRVVVPSSGVVR